MSRKPRTVKVKGLGNHPQGWTPTSRDVPVDAPSLSDMQSLHAANQKKPSQSDMKAAFGEPIDEGKTVRWSIDMRQKRNRQLYKELSTPHRTAQIQRLHEYNGRPKVPLRNRVTGEERLVFAEHEDTVGRLGNMHAPVRAMGCRIERGPGGMLFRLVGHDWLPTGRKCLGIPLDGSDPEDVMANQVSPDGETLWKRRKGEWSALSARRSA